jgi:hypothetical protein
MLLCLSRVFERFSLKQLGLMRPSTLNRCASTFGLAKELARASLEQLIGGASVLAVPPSAKSASWAARGRRQLPDDAIALGH